MIAELPHKTKREMKKYLPILVLIFAFCAKAIGQNPTVTMDSTSDVTALGVKLWGNLVNKGSWTVNGKGFVYSTNPVPTKANGTVRSVSGTSLGKYSSSITNLMPSTTYYVRAYVKKGSGTTADTVYSSNIISFQTLPAVPPTLTTPVISEVGLTEATFTGTITDKGDASLQTDKGFCYGLNQNPTYYDTKVKIGGSASSLPYTMNKEVENLLSGATYYVRSYVVVKYGTMYDTVYSNQVSFTTQHACGNPPYGVTISDIGVSEARINFEKALGQMQWEVDYGFAGHIVGEGSSVRTSDTTVLLSNLVGGRSYSVFVRAICGDLYSEWSDIRTFTTVAPPCAGVSGVHSSEIGYSSAKIEWTPGSMSQTVWEVAFAKANEALPETGVIIEGTPMFSPIGLIPQTEYQLKVRAVCGEFVSDWSDVFTFNTIQQGLEDISANAIKVSPNPTTGTVNFENKGLDVRKIEISDCSGRLIYRNNELPSSFDFKNRKGMFFILVETESGQQIEKIIVQ